MKLALGRALGRGKAARREGRRWTVSSGPRFRRQFWVRASSESFKGASVEDYLAGSVDEEDETTGEGKREGTVGSEESAPGPGSSQSRGGAKAARGGKDERGHWALKGLNEVEATALGVEIRLHTVKAAVVDARTGNFLSRGASVKMESCEPGELKEALRRLCLEFAWDGPVGCSVTLAVAKSLGVEGTSFTTVGNGVGKILKTFLPRNPMVTMVHTEAAGYAEISFERSMKKYLEKDELVLVCTIGRSLGAVLYNGGHRMRNMGLNRSITTTYGPNLTKLEEKYKDVWMKVSNATVLVPPPPGVKAKSQDNYSKWPQVPSFGQRGKDYSEWPRVGGGMNREDASWHEWVSMVDSYLIQLSDYVKPNAIILMPTGPYTAGPIVESMMLGLKVQRESVSKPAVIPVPSAVGAIVKGAAVGALVELRVQKAMDTLRQAVGQDNIQLSKLSEEQLRATFDYFDDNGDGIVTSEKLRNGLQNLGSSLTPELVDKKLDGMKTSTEGKVTFDEFRLWWTEVINKSPVTFITSPVEFMEIIGENKLVLLQVGFSFCRPCKRFEPTFEEFAEQHKDVKFVRMNGNENEDTIQYCKDDLQVRKTPSFFIFKNGMKLLSWTGANEEKFKSSLDRAISAIEV
ncbi:thioredoxin [Chloropicon primus]|nr:thioredoxin [Chloropicon primus]